MEDFEMVANQYEAMLHRVIHSLHIYKDKDEFHQIALIGLWEAWRNFDCTKGKFSSYAFPYVRGKVMNELARKSRKESKDCFVVEEAWGLMVDEHAVEPLQHKVYEEVLPFLNDREKVWLRHTYIYDLSINQIAKQEGVSPSTVKLWRETARKKLQNQLLRANV